MRDQLKQRLPQVFILMTFTLTWSLLFPAVLARYGIGSASLSNNARNLANFAPTIVAIVLLAVSEGRHSLLGIARAVVPWHIPLVPTICAVALPQLTCAAALGVFAGAGGTLPHLDAWQNSLIFTLVLLPLTAFFEEVGWRYLLLNEMQKRVPPMAAAWGLALIWGLWHLPMYLQNNTEGDRTWLLFVLFMVGVFPVSIFASWFFNGASGRLFPVMLFHASLDASIGYYFGKIPTGELRPFAIWVGLMWLCAGLLYWLVGSRLGLLVVVPQPVKP